MRLEKMDEQRDALIALHQQVMMKVAPSIDDLTDNYEERQLAHAMLDQPRRPVDLDSSHRVSESSLLKLKTSWRACSDRLIRDLARSKGNVIAGGEGTSAMVAGALTRIPYRHQCRPSYSSFRRILSLPLFFDPK